MLPSTPVWGVYSETPIHHYYIPLALIHASLYDFVFFRIRLSSGKTTTSVAALQAVQPGSRNLNPLVLIPAHKSFKERYLLGENT